MWVFTSWLKDERLVTAFQFLLYALIFLDNIHDLNNVLFNSRFTWFILPLINFSVIGTRLGWEQKRDRNLVKRQFVEARVCKIFLQAELVSLFGRAIV